MLFRSNFSRHLAKIPAVSGDEEHAGNIEATRSLSPGALDAAGIPYTHIDNIRMFCNNCFHIFRHNKITLAPQSATLAKVKIEPSLLIFMDHVSGTQPSSPSLCLGSLLVAMILNLHLDIAESENQFTDLSRVTL
jgi:hypothetical protein